ncbi:MAG: septum formation initiator family protein [bacterium]|jgi:cell division protein FtsB
MKRSRRRLSKKGRWIIVLLIIALPLFYFSRRVYKLVSSIQEENNLKKEIIILKAENEVMQNRINEYKRRNILEAKARDDLGMIKKGEKVYLVPRK